MGIRSAAPQLVLAAAFAVLAIGLTVVAAGDSIPFRGDVATAERIQREGALGFLAEAVNLAGSAWQWLALLGAIAVVVLARRDRRVRVAGLAALAGAMALQPLSTLLKAIVQSPRPGEGSGLRLDEIRYDYGFPSGHVYSDVLIYGVIAVLAPLFLARAPAYAVQLTAIAIILLAGPARVYTGAHWPSDVVGGYLWGAAALCAAVAIGRLAAEHPRLAPIEDYGARVGRR